MIKLKVKDLVLRTFFESELLFFEKILPFLLECRGPIVNDANALFVPRFFYGRNKCSELMPNYVIVIENVSTLGYCLSNDIVFLDYDHLSITLQTIAKLVYPKYLLHFIIRLIKFYFCDLSKNFKTKNKKIIIIYCNNTISDNNTLYT